MNKRQWVEEFYAINATRFIIKMIKEGWRVVSMVKFNDHFNEEKIIVVFEKET